MKRKLFSGIMLTILLTSMLTSTFNMVEIAISSLTETYCPSGFDLLDQTEHVGGLITDLQNDDSIVMSFKSFLGGTPAPRTLWAHAEIIYIAGAVYQLLRVTSADHAGQAHGATSDVPARVPLEYRSVYSLKGVSSIPSSAWTFRYLGYAESGMIAHIDVDVRILKADGTVREVIASHVADSSTLSTLWTTHSGTFDFPGYPIVVDSSDYLLIEYYAHITTPHSGSIAYLYFDVSGKPPNDQTSIQNIYLPLDQIMGVEFTGSSELKNWSELYWVVDSAFNISSVPATFQLYDFACGAYPTSGDGYISYTSNATPNTQETKSQNITSNPTRFRDSSGNWKIKVTGIKTITLSSFLWLADLIKLQAKIIEHDIALSFAPAMQWNKTYGGPSLDLAYSIVQSTDGGYALAGYTSSYGAGGYDFWLVKTDPIGYIQWNKTYGGASTDRAHSMIQTADGGYALAGHTNSYGAGSADFWLIKTESSKTPVTQWNQACGGISTDFAESIVQTKDGGYATAGYTYSYGAGSDDFWLVKTDSAGNILWNKTYGGADSEGARSLVQTSDGGYALVGYTRTYGAGSYDIWFVKTDSAGNVLWNKTYGGTNDDQPYSVIRTSDGGYAIAGYTYSFGAGLVNSWLIKTDSNGNMQWNKTYGGEFSNGAHSLVQTTDGGYAIAGSIYSYGAGDWDYWFVKTDLNGNEQWNKTYGGVTNDQGNCIVQTSNGEYVLAGMSISYGAGFFDAWLVKTDSNGNMQWNRAYGGADDERAYSVIQTGDGGYAFAGFITIRPYGAGGSTDFWLVKVDSAGNLQWDKTYGGTDEDYVHSMIQTSDDGYALAGGIHYYGAGSSDFWLIKTGPSLGVDRRAVQQGQNVNFHVAAKNEGTETETFNITAYYNNTAIETRTITNLEPNEETTITFIWNTTGVLLGNYTLSAYAHPIPGETETADNTFIDGTVKVIHPWGDWTHYHNYNEIINTLLYLNNTYPNIVDMFSIGKSWQNQDIYCIRLTNETNTHPKPKVFFVGYHHARELISAELPLYFAVEAATNFGTNETITHMLNYSEIYIIPALNPDAFDVVKQNEWQRKNVHPYDEDGDGLLDEDPPDDEDGDGYIEDLFFWNGTHYYFIRWEGIDDDSDGSLNEDWIGGVDLNRNYGYQWNATVQSGSPYPWAEDYRGPAPFSEPETQAIRDLAMAHNFKYAISFHSGTEVIGFPWGYTTDPTPDDATFREIAANLSALVGAPYGQNSGLYTASGMWDDWMYANRSTFALTCEIYGNDSAWQYEPGPEPYTWWEKGVFQFFNPDPNNIETVIQRWLPVFTYITNRAITEAYDIATTNITPLKTIVGQGYSVDINVTVTNQGDFTETFNVTAYADLNTTVIGDEITIGIQNVTLPSGDSTTLTFAWNTSGVAKGNHTVTAEAAQLPGETATLDNTYEDGWVIITWLGDLDADFDVDQFDFWAFCSAFIDYYTIHVKDENCDFDDDGDIDQFDFWTFCSAFIDYYKT